MESLKSKDRLIELKRKRLYTKLSFVAFSAFIWFIVKLSVTGYTDTLEYKIRVKSNSPEVVFANEVIDVKLDVESNGFGLLSESIKLQDELELEIDVSDVSSSIYYLNLKEEKYTFEKLLGEQIEVTNISPGSVKLKMDLLASKKLPVRGNHLLKLVPPYNLYDGISFNPSEIEVWAPKTVLDEITYVETEEFEISSEEELQSRTIDLKVPGDLNVSVDPLTVTANYRVLPYTQKSLEVPIRLINLPLHAEVKLFPSTIHIKCNVAVVDFEKINASQFICQADFSELQGKKRIALELNKIPENVEVISWGDKSVEYLMIE